MRTSDFSKATNIAQATAMFIGATRYSGPGAIIRLGPRWLKMVAQMKRMRGYRWHKTYYQFPLTLGTIAFFDTRDDLLLFARTAHHRDLMCWMVDEGTRNGTGGWIRIYSADDSGYTNGVWRAEDDDMAHEERFALLSRERQGPPVHRQRKRDRSRDDRADRVPVDHAVTASREQGQGR